MKHDRVNLNRSGFNGTPQSPWVWRSNLCQQATGRLLYRTGNDGPRMLQFDRQALNSRTPGQSGERAASGTAVCTRARSFKVDSTLSVNRLSQTKTLKHDRVNLNRSGFKERIQHGGRSRTSEITEIVFCASRVAYVHLISAWFSVILDRRPFVVKFFLRSIYLAHSRTITLSRTQQKLNQLYGADRQ